MASSKHVAVAKRAAEESMVLLKNENNILPFDKTKTDKIVVLGVLGDTENIGDHGSSKVHPYCNYATQRINEENAKSTDTF